ncbi:MAG: sigma-54 interaction domain-containing protein [Dethiobacteria bacterium]
MRIMEKFYGDAVIVTDREGKIIYSSLNNGFRGNNYGSEPDHEINKSTLELYPCLDKENCTVLNCLQKGEVIYRERQPLKDFRGRQVVINSLTIPIIDNNEVVGVIEVTQDLSKINSALRQKTFISLGSKLYNREDMHVARYNFSDIITANSHMLKNIEKAKLIADNTSPVLIYGETGTGKELFVTSIHNYSYRRKEPFIVQNCAALPETLFESILFGTTKGAYTGAIDKPGLFELADKGTLFLDEIHSMPNNLQSKLLRVLQDGIIRRIGDSKDRKVNVRIITAMNIDPFKAVDTGQLREDLFYRLNVVGIKLIPLRERKEDIPLYIEYFIDKYNMKFGKRVSWVTDEVEELFMNYNWPGNVREIQHAIESSVSIVDQEKIDMQHLPVYLVEKGRIIKEESKISEHTIECIPEKPRPLRDTIENIEKNMITQTLERVHGNVSKAADMLEITRQSLHYKMDKYNINRFQYQRVNNLIK